MYFAYQRISQDPTLQGEGVSRQRADCIALAERLGWDVTTLEHLTDNNTSAWQRKASRPQFQALLAHITSGNAQGIVIYHLDRLLRRTDELELLIAAVESRATTRNRNPCPIHSTSGIIDLSDPDGRFAARILTAVAQKESDDKSRRIKARIAHTRRAGTPTAYNRRTYGFLADNTIVEPEAAVIRTSTSRILAGESMLDITRELNASGHLPPSQRPWDIRGFGRVLRSHRVGGAIEIDGAFSFPDTTPRILEPETWLAIRAPRRGPRSPKQSFLLSHVARCMTCNSLMTGQGGTTSYRSYSCHAARLRRDATGESSVGHASIIAGFLDELVASHIEHRLSTSPVIAVQRTTPSPEIQLLHDRLAALEDARYVAGTITESSFQRMSAALRTELDATVTTTTTINSPTLLDGWRELPVTQRRDIVASVIDAVVVEAASGFRGQPPNPARVTIIERGT